MTHEVWIGPVAVTALEHCLVLPPGDRAWVDVLVGAQSEPDFAAQVRTALTQYQLQVDGFGAIERVRHHAMPLERTALRLEKELAKSTGVRLMTFRPFTADT